MNNRIQELAQQAQQDYVGYQDKGLYYEIFAKLIVQECIDCVRGAGLTDEVAVKNNLGFNDGLSAAVVNVQKHFGIEE